MSEKYAQELLPGDTYDYRDTPITVLVAPELHTDKFGRPELRIWAKRSDTDAEGWILYGIDALVKL